ncbi:uncharacterized protein [Misgurnus anguillicaudatus]|uniref:uncharacterized protein n=1 Tax=Misgurnus anguillicaudatus TaxID=75329 RepID=UPI003CCFDF74
MVQRNRFVFNQVKREFGTSSPSAPLKKFPSSTHGVETEDRGQFAQTQVWCEFNKISPCASRQCAEGTAMFKYKNKKSYKNKDTNDNESVCFGAAIPSSPTRWRHRATGEREFQRPPCCSVGELARMRSTPLGFVHDKKGLSPAICCKTTTFQQNSNVNSRRGLGSGFRRGNKLFIEQKSHSGGTTGAQPSGVLLPVFSHPETRGGSPSHPRFAEPQQTPQDVQVQNAHTQNTMSIYSSKRLVYISRSEGRLLSHKHLPSAQKISQVCLSRHSLRVFDGSIRALFSTEGVQQMRRGSAHAVKSSGAQSDSLFRRFAPLCPVTSTGGEGYEKARVSFSEFRLQHKRGKELLSTHTGDNLLRAQTELSPVSGFSIGGTNQIDSRLPCPISEGEQGFIQTVFTPPGAYGLYDISRSAGIAANEGVSALDSGAALVSETSPQPQGGSVVSVHGCPPLLETTLFSRVGNPVRDGLTEESGDDGRISVGLGCSVRGQSNKWKMARHAPERAHQLSGTINSLPCTKALCAVPKKPPRSDQIGQHNGGGIHKSPGGHSVCSASLSSTEADRLGDKAFSFTTGDTCPRNIECGGGPSVQRESPVRGMDSPPGGGESAVAEVRPSCRRSLRLARKHSLPSILLSSKRRCTYGCGCSSTPVAKSSVVRVPPTEPDCANSKKDKRARTFGNTDRSTLARQDLAGGDNAVAMRPAVASPAAQGPSVTSARRDFPSCPGQNSSLGLARERLNLSATGLSPAVIETIQSARAASTRSVYDKKWNVFERWCALRNTVPFICSLAEVLCFLQDLLDKGRSFSTIKVYLAAISACHVGFDRNTVGQHPLISRFMRGARRLKRVVKPLIPPWDLSVVLNALSQPPFEPLDDIDLKFLSLKVALLLALSTAKRVSELHALSVHSSCMVFATDLSRVIFKTNPAFIPKVSESALACKQVDLMAFHPPPFSSPEEERLHCLCPVRALSCYVNRTRAIRKNNQLFVSWADTHKGKPISRQRLSHWVVEAIILSYNSRGLTPPAGLRAHSTRGMATSWALFKGVSVQDICAAASWASPHTFVRFYRLDVTEPSLAHSVLSV